MKEFLKKWHVVDMANLHLMLSTKGFSADTACWTLRQTPALSNTCVANNFLSYQAAWKHFRHVTINNNFLYCCQWKHIKINQRIPVLVEGTELFSNLKYKFPWHLTYFIKKKNKKERKRPRGHHYPKLLRDKKVLKNRVLWPGVINWLLDQKWICEQLLWFPVLSQKHPSHITSILIGKFL